MNIKTLRKPESVKLDQNKRRSEQTANKIFPAQQTVP